MLVYQRVFALEMCSAGHVLIEEHTCQVLEFLHLAVRFVADVPNIHSAMMNYNLFVLVIIYIYTTYIYILCMYIYIMYVYIYYVCIYNYIYIMYIYIINYTSSKCPSFSGCSRAMRRPTKWETVPWRIWLSSWGSPSALPYQTPPNETMGLVGNFHIPLGLGCFFNIRGIECSSS